MARPIIRPLLCCLALLLCCLPAAGQDHPISVPPELEEFWKRWVEAKTQTTDDEMDRTARRYLEDAEYMLNVLLDDISRNEVGELHHEIRLLAWALDRVGKTERYISRARFVIDLPQIERRRRAAALGLWQAAYDGEEEAKRLRTAPAWDKVLDGYGKAAQAFTEIQDWEYAVFCYARSAEILAERGLPWEQSKLLKTITEVAPKLTFDDPALENSQRLLRLLKEQGIDPDGERPADTPSTGAADKRGGLGLDSYAAGAEEIVVQLRRENPKKGLPAITYPGFHTTEQFQLWPFTYIEELGPADFDSQNSGRFAPDGKPWILTRDGNESFGLDRDGDGQPEVTFTTSPTPTRVVVPGRDGDDIALMLATPSDRELMFDVEANYSPTKSAARLRFLPAYLFEAEVLGETWQFFDLNIDGVIGPAYEIYGDGVTDMPNDERFAWAEPDGVLIGKAKRAVPWSSVVPVGDSWYRTWSEEGSGEVRLKQLNLATGELLLEANMKVAPETVVVQEVSELLVGAYFEIVPERRGKPVRLPVGRYQLVSGRISKGKKTSMDQVRIYAGHSEPFEVKEGEVTTLALGAPYKLRFETRAEGSGRAIVGRSIRIEGRAGEEYAMLWDEALQPDVLAQTSEGKKAGKPLTMRKCSIAEWERNTDADNILWFPLDEVIEVPSGQTWEFKLTQKTHSLLGGPLESDWTR